MLQWLRNLTGLGAKSAPARTAQHHQVKARYDNALWTDENQRQWWMADYLSAKAANNFQTRRMLRMRSRYEVSNNPYLFGICNSNADDLIGTGPTLQVAGNGGKQIERAWQDWAKEVGLVEKLRTAKLAKTVDGEGFLILKTVEDLYSSVKLYPVDVEADQVTTPAPKNLTELWVDGLDLHPVTGRPVAYHVLKHHPGDFYFPDLNPMKVEKIPARHVIHWFPKFRPGQVRGVPVFTPSLDLFAELRSFRKAVILNANNAANITAVLETEAPANLQDIPAATTNANTAGTPFDKLPIDRGMMVTTPWGAKLKQFVSSQPATTYEMFQEKCLGEACRPLNYPLNLALGTSQKFNFSSARLDHINYRQGLLVERADCDRIVLEAIFRAWFEEAVMVPGLLPAGAAYETCVHKWHWPGFPAMDIAAETKADIDQLNAGTETFERFWAARGYDYQEVLQQQAREKREIEALGLEFGEPLKKQVRIDEDEAGAEAANAA
ncbi:MAG TPA: phage portal protein [Gemmataceae bacterium]|nr:phage portal protein [Gemmataceae bacterium]